MARDAVRILQILKEFATGKDEKDEDVVYAQPKVEINQSLL